MPGRRQGRGSRPGQDLRPSPGGDVRGTVGGVSATAPPRSDPPLLPWDVAEPGRPGPGGAAAVLASLVRWAVLAPSGHNTQPWRFRVVGDAVGDALELRADRTRSLPVVDPADRELVISCGAALETALVAARHLGHHPAVELVADAAQPDLLARVRLGLPTDPASDAGDTSDAGEDGLFEAITRRHTQRRGFDPRPLPAGLVVALAAEAQRCGAWWHVVTPVQRSDVADLVAAGDRAQFRDRAFRRELSEWVRPNHAHQRDGMRAHGFGVGDVASRVAPLVVRLLDRGAGQADSDRRLARDAPLLVVLGTATDDRSAWLRTGRALQRVLLRAESEGVRASLLNQPVELPDLRRELATVLGRAGTSPQLLLRLGHGPAALAQPRRSAGEVLDGA